MVDDAEEASHAPGTLVGDHFSLLRRLGSGGMGEVYLATNLNLPDKRYAIKVLRQELADEPRFAELLNAEAQRQARLDHDNIVQIYDYFQWQRHHCLVMAFVDGSTLADLIAAQPDGLKEAHALDVMLAILRGLNHAHEHGVLHCDIKPANVLVDTEQRVRVTDFGIARDLAPAAPGERHAVVGTPAYMSPEQIASPDRVDHRTDVYSAGIVLFEMLTGTVPFRQSSASDYSVLKQHVEREAPLPSTLREVDPAVDRIVSKALRKEARRRYRGCGDMLADIEAFVGGSHHEQPAPPPGPTGTHSYNVYEHKTLGLQAVKQGFSWAALFGNLFWMFAKGLIPQGLIWVAAYLVLAAVVSVADGPLGALFALAIVVSMLILPGVKGNAWREAQLTGRGYALKRRVAAPTAVAAVAQIGGAG